MFSRLFLPICLLAVLSACQQQKQPSAIVDERTVTKTASENNSPESPSQLSGTQLSGTPALWRLADADTTLYLFGTVHMLPPDVTWKNDALKAAWDESGTIYFETDTGPEGQEKITAILPQIGFNAPGTKLSSFFTGDEWQTITDTMNTLNIPDHAFDSMRPWLAGVALSVQMITADGNDPDHGVETILRQDAETAGKSIRYLESPEQQMNFFADLSDETGAALLYEGVAFYQARPDYFKTLTQAWLHADVTAIGEILIEGLTGPEEVAEVLLYQRNRAWVREIERVMEEEQGTFFVAVGAGHLAGDHSVQAYLQSAGYTVTRF